MIATIIVSLITALAAVLSPNIAEVIRSRNELRIKTMELVYPEKREKFRSLVGCYHNWRDHPETEDYWLSVVRAADGVLLLANPSTCAAVKSFLAADTSDRDRFFYLALECLNQELQP